MSAASRSLAGISCRLASSCARFAFVSASARTTSKRCRSAWALARFARAESTWVWNCDGSRRASTWPFLTIELKSAPSDRMLPDTWLPTWTVVTASSVPVAAIWLTIDPRVTAAVTTSGAASPRRE